MYLQIYIQCIYFFKRQTKDRLIQDYKFISILYFSVSGVNQKHEEKNLYRTSSDPMDN